MLRLIGIALLMAVVSAQGLVGDWEQDEVVQVAAAADLKFALDELLLEYKKAYPKAQRVNLSYGSSGNFFSQIKNGAPFTLYMSADSKYPLELEKANLIVQKTRKSYAVGR
ncbi:MAG: molybdate ABC transporter substrate-binding protein, partial [Deinococcales bacterium]